MFEVENTQHRQKFSGTETLGGGDKLILVLSWPRIHLRGTTDHYSSELSPFSRSSGTTGP
ncbi:hypothetical protein PAENIP36_23390 [Paenibacillus sp. P36]